MASGCGNFHGSLDIFLALHICKVKFGCIYALVKNLPRVGYERFNLEIPLQKIRGLIQGLHADNIQAIDNGGLLCIFEGKDKSLEPPLSCFDGDGKHPFDGAKFAVEGELPHEHILVEIGEIDLL